MSDDPNRAENNSAGVTPQERRNYPRYAFSAAAEAVHLQGDTRVSGRISDLGQAGCYVDTINPFPVDADVKIRIVKDNFSFVAEAKVVYCSTGMGMGLMFTKIEAERLEVLERWIRESGGESRSQAEMLETNGVEHRLQGWSSEPSHVLNELIIALMRKRVLTDAEGKAMLKRLME
jgi:hypothetical protein